MMTEIEQSCAPGLDFEDLVAQHYYALYQFAFSLTRCEADARDLTQQTFYAWASKGGQLRDLSKVKTWLFTTLHRAFLQIRRKQTRFPHYELSEVALELPSTSPARSDQSDLDSVIAALTKVEKTYQAPVVLFYLEERPYKEIAEILGVPMGTVKSRISRGIAQLHNLLTGSVKSTSGRSDRVSNGRSTKRLDRAEHALPWQPALV
jgi:RNA polymerase sigma-70 factor (ECF subfamily)